MQNPNTLYLTYDGLTDPLGQSQVLPYLVGLSEKGWKITVISFEKPERFKLLQETIHKQCKTNGIHWIPKVYHKSPQVFSTLGDLNTLSKTVRKVVKEEKPLLIHCRSYITALVGLRIKNKYGVPFLFDMRGFWADERVDGQIWNLNNPVFKRIYHFFKKKEIEFLQQSDANVWLTNNGLDVLKKWEAEHGTFSPTTVIPCCVDLSVFPLQKKQTATFTLGYIGSIGTWYMLDEMFDFFIELKKLIPDAIFHFLTKDDALLIEKKSQEKGISKDSIIIEAAEREEIKDKTARWDYSIFFIVPKFSKKSSSPTKQGELMAMGIPVICNSGVGDTDYIINKYHSGYLVKEFSNEEYKRIINKIIADKSHLNPVNIREGAKEYYSLEKGIEDYNNIYKTLIK